MTVSDQKKRILVVDDDDTVLSFLTFALKEDGFQVLEAPSAERGLELLKSSIPDLILLDIMLPQMDGFELCQKIREDARFAKTPILFITAYADPSNLKRVAQVGAQGLIEKPIMYSELMAHVGDALAGKFSLPTRLKFGT